MASVDGREMGGEAIAHADGEDISEEDVHMAQQRVLDALQGLKNAVQQMDDSVCYLNAEAGLLKGKMRKLETSSNMLYAPFRAALFEYAAESRGSCA
eukprot:760763-Hanusia_phi.AAC.1